MALPICHRISELHAEGKTNKEISVILGKARHTIAHHLKREGLTFNGPGKTKLTLVPGGNARCRACGEVKPLDLENFRLKRGGSHGKRYFTGTCNPCHLVNKRRYRNRNVFLYRVVSIRAYAKKHELAFDLTEEHLRNLFDKQGGKCFYTDHTLTTEMTNRGSGRHHSLSVDRIFPHEGYVQGNVVLCTLKANTVKNDLSLDEIAAWLPGWYQRIMTFITE
jgi:hypothetical protein